MKPPRILCLTLAALAGSLAVAATPTPQIVRAEVAFFEPEKFTDIRSSANSDGDRNGYLDQIREFVLNQATDFVPPGYLLSVTFTDIDLAGDFPPGQSGRLADVRIVKDIYPPRLTLAFRLTDAEGNVSKQGQRVLTDLAFMMNSSFLNRNDSLKYEKALLSDWFRREFPRASKN